MNKEENDVKLTIKELKRLDKEKFYFVGAKIKCPHCNHEFGIEREYMGVITCPYYLECKTYNIKNVDTTQRSFYFSPSDEFKVIYDAPHFIISFEIYVAREKGNKHIYKCKHYKILSIESLSLDVKYEFNSDNKRMYSGKDGTIILAEGEIE